MYNEGGDDMRKVPVFTIEDIKKMEQDTLSKQKLNQIELIQRAGQKLFETVNQENMVSKKDKIIGLIGKGHNGTDLLWLLKHLFDDGYDVYYSLLFDSTTNDIQNSLLKMLDSSRLVSKKAYLNQISSYDVIFDGILGTGFKGDIDNSLKEIMCQTNQFKNHMISIDIPSGVDASSGIAAQCALKADQTLIIGGYKVGNLLNDAKDYHGKPYVIDIGLEDVTSHLHYIIASHNDIKVERLHHTHKYHYGNIGVISGQKHMFGASVLASHAALRSGAGLVTLYIKGQYPHDLFSVFPEIIMDTYAFKHQLLRKIKSKQIIIYGQGAKQKKTDTLLRKLIRLNQMMVIDASAIYGFKRLIKESNNHKPIILTPHIKEFSTFAGVDLSFAKKKAIDILRQENFKHLYVILKGPTTLIKIGQDIYFVQAGHPGMATAGSGDVLAGMVGAYVLQYGIEKGLIKAVLTHGKAGDLAKHLFGEEAMIASDLIEALKHVNTSSKHI